MPAAAPKIEDQLEELKEKSALQLKKVNEDTEQSKLLAALVTDILPVAKNKEVGVKKYAAKYEDLKQQWHWQKTELDGLKADIINEFPNYVTLIDTKICPIVDAIEKKKGNVDKLATPKGDREGNVAKAKLDADAAKAELDNWFGADTKLAARLNDIGKGIAELQEVFGSDDKVQGIYLLWFKVLPQHQEIAPPTDGDGDDDEDADGDGSGAPPEPKCLPDRDPNAVFLIPPDEYDDRLDAAWQKYRAAREAHQTAEKAFKDNPDDLASETKALKKMRDTQDDDAKKALKS